MSWSSLMEITAYFLNFIVELETSFLQLTTVKNKATYYA